MIINSDFKDYYDYLAHQYRDNKLVYNREEILADDYDKYSDIAKVSNIYAFENLRYWKRSRFLKDVVEVIIIAGRVITN